MRSPGEMLAAVALVGLSVALGLGQETIRPTAPELESLVVTTEANFYATVSAWTFYNIMHVDREKLKAELATSRPSGRIRVGQCGGGAKVQQQTARDFAGYADVYTYLAMYCTSDDKPAKGELFWGGLDDPFVNHARKMRHLCGTTPIVGYLHGSVGPAGRSRPISLEEVQWQFVAALGCGHRGVLWPAAFANVPWADGLKQIEDRIRRYSRALAQARPVDWAKASRNQPVSAAASEGYLFVFLLNPAYMRLGSDGKTVTAPLDKPLCEGSVTLALPPGLKVRRGQTLSGKAVRLTSNESKTVAEFGFQVGGEMLVFPLAGKPEPAAATQPTTQATAARPAATEKGR